MTKVLFIVLAIMACAVLASDKFKGLTFPLGMKMDKEYLRNPGFVRMVKEALAVNSEGQLKIHEILEGYQRVRGVAGSFFSVKLTAFDYIPQTPKSIVCELGFSVFRPFSGHPYQIYGDCQRPTRP